MKIPKPVEHGVRKHVQLNQKGGAILSHKDKEHRRDRRESRSDLKRGRWD